MLLKLKRRIIVMVIFLVLLLIGLIYPNSINASNPTFKEQFPDVNVAQVIAESFNCSVDDEITAAMIEKTKTLALPAPYIKDLTGIEIFVNTEVLLAWTSSNIGQITTLPDNIGAMTKLKIIQLHGNKINKIPQSFGKLTNLMGVTFDNNELTELPDVFSLLDNLESLDFTNNYLTELPDSIGEMESLGEIYLANNQLTSIPKNFKLLSEKGVELWLGNNLLPSNYNEFLSEYTTYEEQNQLVIEYKPLSYPIRKQSDFNQIDYFSFLGLKSNRKLSPNHQFTLTNYINGDGHNILIEDYIKNGIVQKKGDLFPQVRAIGTGMFPNSSDHSVTDERIQLSFEPIYYELSFDWNGYQGENPKSQYLIEGHFGQIFDIPMREGFDFMGWNLSPEGSSLVWTLTETPMLGEDTVLYAQWKPKEYVVKFIGNGGDGQMDNEVFYYGQSKPLTSNTFLRLGYIFKGWSKTPMGEVLYENEATYKCNQPTDLTLYAVWEKEIEVVGDKDDEGFENNTIVSIKQLPKTGGDSAIVLGLFVFMSGSVVLIRTLKKHIDRIEF